MQAAADHPGLVPVFDAIRRGTRRSRLRELAVVCPARHTLIEVFMTADGPVMVWSARGRTATEHGEDGQRTGKTPAPVFVMADELTSWPTAVVVHCRCAKTREVPTLFVYDQFRAGARRAQVP